MDNKITAEHYRQVFNNPVGHKVLSHLLSELGFGRTGLTEKRDLARLEVANRLLQLCGFCSYEGLDSQLAIEQRNKLIANMFNTPVEV